MYVFFYMHIVLEVRNSSESRALAHSHLISRQSTLHKKILLQIFWPNVPVCLACLQMFFFKKCAERSHFRAEFITLLILFYKYFKYLLKSMYFRLRGILGFSVYTCLVVMPRQQLSK